MENPAPRDLKDHLDEITAVTETLREAIGALAATIPDRSTLLAQYDKRTAQRQARTLGEMHSERYLEYLEKHIRDTRAILGG